MEGFKRFLNNNSLSIVLLVLFLIFLGGQSLTGWKHQNNELEQHGVAAQSYVEYIGSGDFMESVFENWESEFLQMGAYVLLTVYLRQKGSAESKKLQGEEDNDRKPKPSAAGKDAPGPVKRGGIVLKLYENSLSIAFILLFILSLLLHAAGGARAACEQSLQHNEPCESTLQFMGTSEFWFQSFQNWQSEFLAVFAIVVLSIWLRQRGSPESKAVSAPYSETGSQ
jgi:hypothetical protein